MENKFMRKFVMLVVLLLVAGAPALTASAATGKTIVDIAVSDKRFTTLVAALSAAGLVDTLNSAGPFTVFAPTNDAFAKLPAGTVEALLADKAALTNILLYHVAAGSVPASTVVTLESATTVQGSKVFISVRGGKVFLNGTVQVIITDIKASNGIIHVIDTVLLPPVALNNNLYVVVRDTPVFSSPARSEIGLTIKACKTVIAGQIWQDSVHVAVQGGWLRLEDLADVAETYGQPGGQAILPGCVGK
jgi:uncharacterized surface protein with fasciclin (FAS1) repeats